MQHILGLVRRCVEDYHMIEAGETVAVGVSGGKDSLLTLTALARLRAFYPLPFQVEAITLETGMPGMDFTPVADYCAALDVPYTRISVPVYDIVFNERKEKNPCSLCAKLRRGSLHTALTERGIHKIALGHHYDDAVETLLMNLLFEGRIGCFQPVTYLDRTDITQIRPLLYCQEPDIRRMASKLALPVVKNTCPMDGHSRRQEVKELLAQLESRYPDLRKKLFGAMQRYPLYGWDLEKMEKSAAASPLCTLHQHPLHQQQKPQPRQTQHPYRQRIEPVDAQRQPRHRCGALQYPQRQKTQRAVEHHPQRQAQRPVKQPHHRHQQEQHCQRQCGYLHDGHGSPPFMAPAATQGASCTGTATACGIPDGTGWPLRCLICRSR